MSRGIKQLIYQERLKSLALFSLERRTLRTDKTEIYKIMKGRGKVNWELLFTKAQNNKTWGYSLKLEDRFKTSRNKYFHT